MIRVSNYYYLKQKCDRVFSEKISIIFYQTFAKMYVRLGN